MARSHTRAIPISRTLFAAIAVSVAVGIGFLALCGLILWDGRRDAENAAETAAHNLAQALEQQIAATINLYDLSIEGVVDGLKEPEAQRFSGRLRNLMLFDRSATAPMLNGMFVTDADGNVTIDSRATIPRLANVADRDYFERQKSNPYLGLFVSPPFQSRITEGEWVMAMSRRIVNPDGSFGGIVFGSFRVDYFADLFRSLTMGSQDSMSIYYDNGATIMRRPLRGTDIGRVRTDLNLFKFFPERNAGRFEGVSLDGVHRNFTFTRIGNLPLVLQVGIGTQALYAPWKQKATILIAIMTCLSLLVVSLARLLATELHRRVSAERHARESEARQRLLAENSSDAIVLRNTEGVREYASPAFYRLLGRTPEEVGLLNLTTYLDPASADQPAETRRRVMAGESRVTELLHCQRGDGAWIWLESISSPVLDEDGQVAGVVTNLRDVTARKDVEEKLASAVAKLEVLAAQDGLTGLANRRCFDETLQREWRRVGRDGAELSLLVFDVDHFKAYNDHYGHAAGDAALCAVASIIADKLHRAGDVAARYGGEEFAIILPATGMLGAWHVAEAIRTSIYEMNLTHQAGVAGRLTVSVGVATIVPHGNQVSPVLFEAADAALYRAKEAGRNRIVRATPGAADRCQEQSQSAA